MRTHSIGEATTIEYPDLISFCFNHTVINIYGEEWSYVECVVTDMVDNTSHTEKREFFKTSVFFDISTYMQASFDMVNENKVDYSQSGAFDSKLGRLFSVELNLYKEGQEQLGNSFFFNTFAMWGAMRVGERYNGNRTLTWFRNYPFSVGLYSAVPGAIKVTADNIALPDVDIPSQNVWNVILKKDIDATDRVELYLPGNSDTTSVFDYTFDFTFRGLANTSTKVICLIDDCTSGVYLRWINRHGFYCYWLFQYGEEARQVINDGEFIRNNMADYSFINGYHGGTGRKQRKTESDTLPVCAPLIDSDTYDFLFEIATSPVVDMYAGNIDGVDRWKGVNVSVDKFIKTKASLQDFVCTIILPELNLQSL